MESAPKSLSEIDPKGLFKDAYAIEGISEPECRTIFLDWAISLPSGHEAADLIGEIIAHFAEQSPDHPMSLVLREGLEKAAAPARRRGGARGRR